MRFETTASLCAGSSAIKSDYQNLKYTTLIFEGQDSYCPCWHPEATLRMLTALPTAAYCGAGGNQYAKGYNSLKFIEVYYHL